VGDQQGELEPVLCHAQRLAALLFVHELTPPHRNEVAGRWLLGRAAEVERFAESVVDDLALGLLDDRVAAATLQGYLSAIHVGLASMVGATAPSCCHPPPAGRGLRRRS
jgi:hypothetical protein